MKRKIFIVVMTVTVAASVMAGCGKTKKESVKESVKEEQNVASDGEILDTEEGTADQEYEDLIKQENDIITEDIDVWNKIFEKVDNEDTQEKMDNGQSYIEYLKESADRSKEILTDEEYEKAQNDIVKIEAIEKKISEYETRGE